MALISANPATGEVMRRFDPLAREEVEAKLQLAADTFAKYRKSSFAERARCMVHAAEVLEQRKAEFGRLMTLEMGKTIRSAVQEAEKCAWACRYYAENAEQFLSDEESKTNAERSFVRYQPIGPVLAIMPWNFPFWQVFRFAAPGLMAGNVGLLKHASNVPQCALAIEEIFREAGFPAGVFQTLLVGSDRTDKIIEDPRVAAVTLTGSVGAGSAVGKAAGKAIKKMVLELGGSDPFIVMPSADLKQAATTAVQARCINNGQSCIAAKRFIVHEKIFDEFQKKFVERMKALKVGDPLQDSTDVGPLATPEMVDILEDQVQRSVKAGTRVLTGGRRLERAGNFYEPTALCDIPQGSPAQAEEMFGPVASLFAARDMQDAIKIANDSEFGLGSCAWTNDKNEQAMFIDGIEAGMAFVNGMVASDPRLPFGGVKQSGYGRELSYQGIREFVNIKTVSIQRGEQNKSETE